MNPQLAQKILRELNHPSTFSAIEDYIKYRLEVNRDLLEQELSTETQGRIRELRKFLDILKAAQDVINKSKSR